MNLKKTLGNGRLDNISAPDITACGIDLNPARLRLLCKNLSDNTYLGINERPEMRGCGTDD